MTALRRALAPEEMTPGEVAVRLAAVGAVLVLATVAVALMEQVVGVGDASPTYLVAVVLAAGLLGTWAAVATSGAAFLVYDYLFVSPRLTLAISSPAEWLSLLLFLIVAVVIGRLTALQRERAEEAGRRVREGVALVAMSRDVAMAASFGEAAAQIALRLQADAEMDEVWVDAEDAPSGTVAWTGTAPPVAIGGPWLLARAAADDTSEWIRFHGEAVEAARDAAAATHYLVAIDAGEGRVGWIHATRSPLAPRPGRGARRLLALAADQLAIAHRRDRLAADLTSAEVARQGEALRAMILDSVAHDLRTPVASIRALAGGLADAGPDLGPGAVRATATQIDAEGERLGDLVNDLLQMGRIQAGGLRPDLRPYDPVELVETTLRHHPPGRADREIEADVPDDLPPVLADAVLFDAALGNVVDNVAVHTPPQTRVRLSARVAEPGWVALTVDDAGPGVPGEALAHLFERFYRVAGPGESARHGMGLGLAIAKGFVEAMGGTIAAEASGLGGLRIQIRLLRAPHGDGAQTVRGEGARTRLDAEAAGAADCEPAGPT